jgi:hypothetical protein
MVKSPRNDKPLSADLQTRDSFQGECIAGRTKLLSYICSGLREVVTHSSMYVGHSVYLLRIRTRSGPAQPIECMRRFYFVAKTAICLGKSQSQRNWADRMIGHRTIRIVSPTLKKFWERPLFARNVQNSGPISNEESGGESFSMT